MNVKTFRVAIFLVLCLTIAASASAECAWVLWQELTMLPRMETLWSVEGAYETKPLCIAGISFLTERRKKEVSEADKRAFGVWGEKYYCLPDTVDPRGAKGGGR